MPIEYSIPVRNEMLTALKNRLDSADPVPGYMLMYTADQPATAGDPITDQTMLARINLALPCGAIADGILTLTTPLEDSNVAASGTLAWGRLLDGSGTWVADFDIGLTGSGATLEISTSSLIVYQGGILRINYATLDLT